MASPEKHVLLYTCLLRHRALRQLPFISKRPSVFFFHCSNVWIYHSFFTVLMCSTLNTFLLIPLPVFYCLLILSCVSSVLLFSAIVLCCQCSTVYFYCPALPVFYCVTFYCVTWTPPCPSRRRRWRHAGPGLGQGWWGSRSSAPWTRW